MVSSRIVRVRLPIDLDRNRRSPVAGRRSRETRRALPPEGSRGIDISRRKKHGRGHVLDRPSLGLRSHAPDSTGGSGSDLELPSGDDPAGGGNRTPKRGSRQIAERLLSPKADVQIIGIWGKRESAFGQKETLTNTTGKLRKQHRRN